MIEELFARLITVNDLKLVTLVSGLPCCGLIISCDQTATKVAVAESECAQKASAITGFNPSNPTNVESKIGKGAAYGAVSGAAPGEITSSRSRKVVAGAAIGAAAVVRIMPLAKDPEGFQRIVAQMETVKISTLWE